MSTPTDEFKPRWASPPGDSIRTAMVDRNWSVANLASELDITYPEASDLLNGSASITIRLARRLAATLGGTTRFWVNRDARYRESLDWIEADRWVSALPLSDMTRLGWLESSRDWHTNVTACMDFFGVEAPAGLHPTQVRIVGARYRARPKTLEQDAAITAWVRRVKTLATGVRCADWDRSAFEELLPHLAALSRKSDPLSFVPELQRLASEVGVVLVVVRAPSGCPANGVSMALPSGTRVIGLSGRYLADDHLWFTMFHEAAHLILHDQDNVYIDEITLDGDQDSPELEAEADRFASELLLPKSFIADLTDVPSPTEIHGLANTAGVSDGIVVGQLQHLGILPYKTRLNKLKRRYRWDGPTLTRGSARTG